MKRAIGLILGTAVMVLSSWAQAASYAIIVHKDSKVSAGAGAKAQLRSIFLKEDTYWANGTLAKPYGRSLGSPEQTAFIEHVLGMSEEKFAQYWLTKKQITGETAPRAISNPRSVIKLIKKHPGAVGIVKVDPSNSEALKDVRVLFELND